MNARRWLRALLAAGGLAGCSAAPVMKASPAGRPQPEPSKASGGSRARAAQPGEYQKQLRAQQYFDQTFDYYADRLDRSMQTLGRGYSAKDVPSEGIPYFYVQRVMDLGQAHVDLARAFVGQGDYVRAERSAYNAVELVEARCLYNDTCIAQVEEQAWGLLADVYQKTGRLKTAAWAQTQQQLKEDFLSSPDGVQAGQEFEQLRRDGEEQLREGNKFIRQANSQRRSQMFSRALAVAAAAGSIASSFQEAQIRASGTDGGLSSDQLARLQMVQLNRTMANMALMATINRTGDWGNGLAIAHSLGSPQMFRQFTEPSAGVRTDEIMQGFTQRLTQLGRGDLVLGRNATAVSGASANLNQVKQGGSPKQKQDAFKKFLDAYGVLTDAVRRMQ